MVGGTLTAFLAALHYWFPKMFGRMYSEGWGIIGATMVILGFAFTFTPQFLLGNAGMPRRYFSYPAEFQWLNIMSTAGASILGLGMAVTLGYLGYALFRGPRAGDNPWRSRGFEWRTPTPPPVHNFAGTPDLEPGAYDYHVASRHDPAS
jgi:cytochrome c oxidase subunit 1